MTSCKIDPKKWTDFTVRDLRRAIRECGLTPPYLSAMRKHQIVEWLKDHVFGDMSKKLWEELINPTPATRPTPVVTKNGFARPNFLGRPVAGTMRRLTQGECDHSQLPRHTKLFVPAGSDALPDGPLIILVHHEANRHRQLTGDAHREMRERLEEFWNK